MKYEILTETMAPNRSNQFTFIRSEIWYIIIENLAWDLFSELEKCSGWEWNIFPGIFQGFYMFIKDTHFQNHLNSRFLVVQPKIAVLMNYSTLIYIKTKSKGFQKICRWLHHRLAKKLLTTLRSFLQIFCKAYVVELSLLLHRRYPSNF